MEQLSICIPTWNRYELTINSFSKVLNDERIAEVIIVDDASTDGSFEKLLEHLYVFNSGKIKLHRNSHNIDCYRNKCKAVSFSETAYCILLDSDNIISKEYLDKIYEYEWDENTILAPTFAKPNFDYRAFSGLTITKENVGEYMSKPMFSTALNTANYFVNKANYLEVWDGKVDPVTSDSIYFNYCWLNSGRKIHFVEGLEYFHLVHPQSHYQNNVKRTPQGFHEQIELQLKQMS